MARHPDEAGSPGPAVVLTGGIGSGKSTVGHLLATWGAFRVDADQLARDVVAPGSEGLAELVTLLGSGIVDADGSLDRAAMAERVFADAALLAEVEAIIHPRVLSAGVDAFAQAPAGAVRVYEVPLPGRSPFPEEPIVVVVDAPDDLRRARLMSRGLSAPQIIARMRQQPTRQDWLEHADRVVDNSGTLAELEAQVADLWREITGREPPVGADG